MQKLTNKEEEIMHILWKLKKAFVKDILRRNFGRQTALQHTFHHS